MSWRPAAGIAATSLALVSVFVNSGKADGVVALPPSEPLPGVTVPGVELPGVQLPELPPAQIPKLQELPLLETVTEATAPVTRTVTEVAGEATAGLTGGSGTAQQARGGAAPASGGSSSSRASSASATGSSPGAGAGATPGGAAGSAGPGGAPADGSAGGTPGSAAAGSDSSAAAASARTRSGRGRTAPPGPARRERRLRRKIRSLAGCLYGVAPSTREVLVLRAGLGGADPLSLSQVAQAVGVSPRQARAIQRRGVRRLVTTDRADGCGRAIVLGSPAPQALPIAEAGTPVAALTRPGRGGSRDLSPAGRREATPPARAPAPGRAVDPVRPSAVVPPLSATLAESDGGISPWIPAAVGLLAASGIAGILLLRGRSSPVRAGAGQAWLDLPRRCPTCASTRVVVNVNSGAYRCADCAQMGITRSRSAQSR